MEIRLLVLGLLMEGKSYGYDLGHKIRERLSGCVNLRVGSIYYSIRICLQEGYIQGVGTEKKGVDPTRILYKITPEGAKFYKKAIQKYFEDSDLNFSVNPALLLLGSLSPEQFQQYVEERIEQVTSQIEDVKSKLKNATQTDTIYLLEYVKQHLEAELAWFKIVSTKK